jgi:hypothetical protein
MKVNIKGFESFGPWTVAQPNRFIEQAIYFGQQVTAPVSLGAVHKLIAMAKQDPPARNPLLSTIPGKTKSFHTVLREDFAAVGLKHLAPIDMSDDLLGFLSLVVSYAKATVGVTNPAAGPKQSLSIMPRTDFATMYNAVAAAPLKRQLQDTSLFEIVKRLASRAGDGNSGDDPRFPRDGDAMDKAVFRWEPLSAAAAAGGPPSSGGTAGRPSGLTRPATPRAGSPIDPDTPWDSRDADVRTGRPLVRTWLDNVQRRGVDVLAVMDGLLLDGQIGALGPTMESHIFRGANTALPVFEFCDLGSVALPRLDASVADFESAVVAFHRDEARRDYRSTEHRNGGDLTCAS